MAAVAPGQAPVPQQAALPLFDHFLDLPHPGATASCPPPFSLGAPSNSPEMEKELAANLSRIARFAFPEFDDATSQNIRRDTALNHFSRYAMQAKTFQHYTFSLQLQSGVRVHGHVRRYLPMHLVAKTRYDVGRRGERALVILTRASGGDLVYSAILKTLDAISFQKGALEEKKQPHSEPKKWFLHKLFEEHRKLCAHFATLPLQKRKPMILTLHSVEVGLKKILSLDQVDTVRYLIPTSILSPTSSIVESVSSAPILPILRVLGVQNTLRLLSALLSESRVLMTSSSPTRLAQCASSALSILAQGLLNWQHLYIPVLPPHLFQYLAAPVPYLIGMLTSLVPRLDHAKSDLGEMVIIDLDSFQMETRGIKPADVAHRIPDLFRTAMAEQGLPQASMSASEMLAQDLVDLLKVDKRSLYGESTLTNVSEQAAKATKAVKTGFMKAMSKGKKFLQNRTTTSVSESSKVYGGGTDGGANSDDADSGHDSLLPDYIYTQGCQNEVAEEEARIAFASFFLAMFGNMRWYLSASPGKLPQLDRKRFLQQKRAMGEGENTPIWPLLQNFCQTQMLEQFAKARVEEVRTRMPITADSPLFSQCANYHRLHSIDFSVVNVRRVARQVAQNSPSRPKLLTSARRTAMLLTSSRTFEGDYNKAVSQLVEQCRECSSVLSDVMSVIWIRLRDSKGLQWKHGFQSLQILRNLLYHGPLAAIAEATDGLDKIRLMKYYNDNMRSQTCTQIRQAATQIYNLLVDRAKLYNIRRLCIDKRRRLQHADRGRLVKDRRINFSTPFANIHAALNPKFRGKVAPNQSFPGASRTPQSGAEPDLLGLTNPPSPAAQTSANAFVPGTSANDKAKEMMGLFDAVSISNPPVVTPSPNPFTASGQPPAGQVPPSRSPNPNSLAPHTQPTSQYQPRPQLGANPYNSQPASVSDPFGAAKPNIQTGHPQPTSQYQSQKPGVNPYNAQPATKQWQVTQPPAPAAYTPHQQFPTHQTPIQSQQAQQRPQVPMQQNQIPQVQYSAGHGAAPAQQHFQQQAQGPLQGQQYYNAQQQTQIPQTGQVATPARNVSQFDPFG